MDGYRHENKFFISSAACRMLQGRLRAAMEQDEHTDPDRRYLIRSLYLDDYLQSGLVDRFIRLESKQKVNTMTRKLSAPLTREQADAILRGDLWEFHRSEHELLRNFYLKARTRLLRPAVIVDYEREAYVFQDVRITFDHDLHTGNYATDLFSRDLFTLPVLPSDRVIMEVKYDDALPYFVRQLLKSTPAIRCAISKYELCRGLQ